MASGKQYKNVYTILEKVRKGEIQSHYKEKDGLFGKIDFYKKPDLIKPHMHFLDERSLEKIVEAHLHDQTSIRDFFVKLGAQSKYKALPEDKKPDFNKFYSDVSDTYRKFPKHIMKDIYKLYYHQVEQLDFEDRTEKTQTRFKFLEKANNPVGKIMSQSSCLKSSIFTRNMMLYYMMQLAAMEYLDPQAHQQMMNGLNGSGDEFNQDDIDDAMKKMFESKFGKDQLEKAMDDAQQMCKSLDENIPDDVQTKMFEEANKNNGGDVGKISPDYMRQIAARLENISLSMGSLKEKIKKLLDKSVSYFSAQEITTYEDLFNSDNIAGLDDFVLLHPKLRNFMAEDVMIKDIKKVGKIDIYIDVSGSMGSGSGTKDKNGQHISKIDFAKSFAAKLKEMDMLNDVYLFDTRVKKLQSNDIVSIAMIDCGGGTDIDFMVEKLKTVGNNAIVITDAEDRCSIYSPLAYFIGVEGSRFTSFDRQYMEKNQVIIFNGTSVKNVNLNGLPA
jgi:hypothetical protein